MNLEPTSASVDASPDPSSRVPTDELDELGLRFGSDTDAGLRRIPNRTGGFHYVAANGNAVSKATSERIVHLAIPPAWTSVWIARSPSSHVQATGRDARKRKQYRYHPKFQAHNEITKFADLLTWGIHLHKLRARLRRDLARRRPDRNKVIALAITMLDETSIRVGNEQYAQSNGSYGLTTLRNTHARLAGDTISLRFVGKSGKSHDVSYTDRKLARAMRTVRDLPGELLFHYVSADTVHPIHASDINDYLTTTMGTSHTAKTFRTWNATVSAAAFLAAYPPPKTPAEGRRIVTEAMRATSRLLGNTPAVVRRSYVHPGVITAFNDGSLATQWVSAPAPSPRLLDTNERRALRLLRRLT